MLTDKDIKLMRYIYRSKHPTRAKLCRRFGKDLLDSQSINYVRLHDPRTDKTPSGIRMGEIPASAEYYLTHEGVAEVDSRKWFTWDYVVKHIIVPIVVGVFSAAITAFITSGRLPFL